MRIIPDTFDPAVVGAIDEHLDTIAAEQAVAMPLAVESGSRAWGFPSPDSDYDCRFVYVRLLDAYLTPWLPRDVIESPPDGVLDVNGWDLRKAVQLLVNGNAVILEWLRSPIVYRANAQLVADFLALAEVASDRTLLGRHYLHVGRQQWERFGTDDGRMPLKKLFYCLRPALALLWLRQHPNASVPPMTLQELMDEADPPHSARSAAEDLVARKAVTKEMRGRRSTSPA